LHEAAIFISERKADFTDLCSMENRFTGEYGKARAQSHAIRGALFGGELTKRPKGLGEKGVIFSRQHDSG
jgi:hypothetical protein